MTARSFPSPKRLRQLLRFEAETGKLYWLPRPREMFVSQRSCSTWNARFAGKEALTARSGGYRVGNVDYKQCMAHRVVWALVHGYWPPEDLDHINGDRGDNRLCNLREATRAENNCNRPKPSANTSGFKGVGWNSQRGRWQAQISLNNKGRHIGFFDDPEEAHAAYCKAAATTHRDFARTT